jgi:hypothetical protein
MLHGAGITTDGLDGNVKVAGLVSIYLPVFGTWLEDDDPGHAKTMAALDRRLRRGGDFYQGMESAVGGVTRIAGDLPKLAGMALDNLRRILTPSSAQGTTRDQSTTNDAKPTP